MSGGSCALLCEPDVSVRVATWLALAAKRATLSETWRRRLYYLTSLNDLGGSGISIQWVGMSSSSLFKCSGATFHRSIDLCQKPTIGL